MSHEWYRDEVRYGDRFKHMSNNEIDAMYNKRLRNAILLVLLCFFTYFGLRIHAGGTAYLESFYIAFQKELPTIIAFLNQ